MTVPGKRETHKRATRQALQAAADRLFAERGYRETTVREIADAAGVTERTVFRYFAGKEELLVEDLLTWADDLAAAIRRRPAAEPPLAALPAALRDLAARRGDAPVLHELFAAGPPAARLGQSAPGILDRIETVIAAAFVERLTAARTAADTASDDTAVNDNAPDLDLVADVQARCAVATLRAAALRFGRMRAAGDPTPLSTVVRQALAVLTEPSTTGPAAHGERHGSDR